MLQIIWDKQARDAWQEIADYCRTFGPKSVEKFAGNVQSWVIAIAQNPGIGKTEPLLNDYAENFRSIVVHKNCKIIYYIQGEYLHIADLWDTRREPRTLADSLK